MSSCCWEVGVGSRDVADLNPPPLSSAEVLIRNFNSDTILPLQTGAVEGSNEHEVANG